MSAHPMICPLPRIELAHVQEEFDSDAAKLFELITKQVDDYMSTSKQLQVEIEFRSDPLLKLVGFAAPESSQDLPRSSVQNITFQGTRDRGRDNALSVDALLDWIAQGRLMSPSRMSSVFQELLEAGWVQERDGEICLTQAGGDQLERGRGQPWATLTPQTIQTWRDHCAHAAKGCGDVGALMGSAEQLFGVKVSHRAAQIMSLIPAN